MHKFVGVLDKYGERRDLLCNVSNGDLFTCEDNMLFSRVKMSCFCAKAHLVFHSCLYNKLYYYIILLLKQLAKNVGENRNLFI